MFRNKTVKEWIVQHLVESFDEVHITLAALYHICHQNGFQEFAITLSIYLAQEGIVLDAARMKYFLSGLDTVQ